MTKDEALAMDLALEALELSKITVDSFGVQRKTQQAITAIKQARSAPPTHKTARWTDEEYREISDQVISTLVEYGAELRTSDCQMQVLREELAESRREVAQLKAQRQWTDIDIDHLSVLAGFDPSHKVELGLVRSVVRTILRGKTK
jgi:hypothetical protein